MRVYEQMTRYELYSIDELQGKARLAAIDNVRELILDGRDTWDFGLFLDDYFYNVNDYDIFDYIACDGMEFLADGTIFKVVEL